MHSRNMHVTRIPPLHVQADKPPEHQVGDAQPTNTDDTGDTNEHVNTVHNAVHAANANVTDVADLVNVADVVNVVNVLNVADVVDGADVADVANGANGAECVVTDVHKNGLQMTSQDVRADGAAAQQLDKTDDA